MSHPAWVCGLKLRHAAGTGRREVTPCVGVWIETASQRLLENAGYVTPCVGVWIETYGYFSAKLVTGSHPAWVCGLKLTSLLVYTP